MSAPDVFKILSANPILQSAFGKRIFNSSVPDGIEGLYLVWQGVGSAPENTIDCGATNENDSYQFVIWGHKSRIPQIEDLRNTARKTLEMAGLYYRGKHPDAQDAETKLLGRGWDMSWWTE